jgi:hypothetical protein
VSYTGFTKILRAEGTATPYQGSQELSQARLSGLPTGSFELGQPRALLQESGPIRSDTHLRDDYRFCEDGLYTKARLLAWTVPPNLCHGDLAHADGMPDHVRDSKETRLASGVTRPSQTLYASHFSEEISPMPQPKLV